RLVLGLFVAVRVGVRLIDGCGPAATEAVHDRLLHLKPRIWVELFRKDVGKDLDRPLGGEAHQRAFDGRADRPAVAAIVGSYAPGVVRHIEGRRRIVYPLAVVEPDGDIFCGVVAARPDTPARLTVGAEGDEAHLAINGLKVAFPLAVAQARHYI